jgi:hypothetical protein
VGQKVLDPDAGCAESELRKRVEKSAGVGFTGTNEDVEVRRIAGPAVVCNGESPYDEYSTSFEFNNAINSRKSLLSGIRVAQVAELDGDTQALFGTQARIETRVGLVRRCVAIEDPDNFLHNFIVSAC